MKIFCIFVIANIANEHQRIFKESIRIKQWIIIYKRLDRYYFDKIIFMICPICKSKVHKVYKVIKKTKIFECRSCQIGFVLQKIKNTVSSRSYQDGRMLYNFHEYKQGEGKLRKRFSKLIKIITEYKKYGKVLDVGAGFGLFSSILKTKENYSIDIIEPSLKYRYIDITISNIYNFTFEEFKGRKEFYDIIIVMDVLEHFRDPLKNLKKAKSLLKNDGILVIQTPNYKSLMAKICKNWAWWMIEDHKFFFSPKSIKLMLNKTGFGIKYFITYEDFADFKKNLDGNFAELRNGLVRRFIKGLLFSIFFPIYFLAKKILWELKYGGLIFIIAKK